MPVKLIAQTAAASDQETRLAYVSHRVPGRFVVHRIIMWIGKRSKLTRVTIVGSPGPSPYGRAGCRLWLGSCDCSHGTAAGLISLPLHALLRRTLGTFAHHLGGSALDTLPVWPTVRVLGLPTLRVDTCQHGAWQKRSRVAPWRARRAVFVQC